MGVRSAQSGLRLLSQHVHCPPTTRLSHGMFPGAPGIWMEILQFGGILGMIKWGCVSSSPAPQSSRHAAPTVLQTPVLFTQEHTHPGWSFSDAEGRWTGSKSGHRGTSKVWRGEGGKVASGALPLCCPLSCRAQTPVCGTWTRAENLGGGGVALFLPAPTGLADTADDTRGRQEQQGRRHQGDDAQAHQDPHHLGPVPHHWGSRVAQLIPAGPPVIVSQEDVIVQVLEAVPAERVLAVLTHHLRAALIAFDVHPAHGARLNGGFCVHAKEGPMLCWQGNGLAVSAGAIRMPRVLAARAELPLARRALHQHRLARLAGSHGADGLTVCGGTPRPAGVQVNLSFKFQPLIKLELIHRNQTGNLGFPQGPVV